VVWVWKKHLSPLRKSCIGQKAKHFLPLSLPFLFLHTPHLTLHLLPHLQLPHLDKPHSGVKDTEGHLRWFHFHLHPLSRRTWPTHTSRITDNASNTPKFSERRHEFLVKSYARDSWLDQKHFYWTRTKCFEAHSGSRCFELTFGNGITVAQFGKYIDCGYLSRWLA